MGSPLLLLAPACWVLGAVGGSRGQVIRPFSSSETKAQARPREVEADRGHGRGASDEGLQEASAEQSLGCKRFMREQHQQRKGERAGWKEELANCLRSQQPSGCSDSQGSLEGAVGWKWPWCLHPA